jgi:hypothetical protein
MKKVAVFSIMAVLALGACSDEPTGTENLATIRVVNATSGTNFASVIALDGDEVIASGVTAGNATVCTTNFTIRPGSKTINFRTTASGTTNLESVTHDFQANRKYLVILYGTNADVRAMVLDEETTPEPATTGNRRLRIINASVNATAADVYARTTATGAPAAGSAIATNVGPGTAASGTGGVFFTVPETNNIIQFFPTGTTATARAAHTVSTANFPPNRNATIFLRETNTFQMNGCN